MVCRGRTARKDGFTPKKRVTGSPRVVWLTPDFALFPSAIGFPHSVITWLFTKQREVGHSRQFAEPTRGGRLICDAFYDFALCTNDTKLSRV